MKFENHKNCLVAIQLDNKIKYLKKIKFNIDSLKNDKIFKETINQY